MKRGLNPTEAYLKAKEKAATTCEQNKTLPTDKNNKDCEHYSRMLKLLNPIDVAYKKNEQELRMTIDLERESYTECVRFQDHSDERIDCRWHNLFNEKHQKLREERTQLEKQAEEIFRNPSASSNKP